MKPILFNAEMVRAILDGRKTVTRRAVKPAPAGDGSRPEPLTTRPGYWNSWGDDNTYRQPYQVGEVLYVPEPWRCMGMFGEIGYVVGFKDGKTVRFMFQGKARAEKWAKYGNKPFEQWQSPYFMPREAARIFLRVTHVRVERLQSIETAEIEAEGISREPLDEVGEEFYRGMFSDLWDKTVKPADRALYGWAANPWVWVIQFERISGEEARHDE